MALQIFTNPAAWYSKRIRVLLLSICSTCMWFAVQAQQVIPVVIDPSTAGKAISPLLFSHNLEVTRKGIWTGLSAEMIANRKFAATKNNLPLQWLPANKTTQLKTDTTTSFAGKHSVYIYSNATGVLSGLYQQQQQLAFTTGQAYVIKLYTKTTAARFIRLQIKNGSTHLLDTIFQCKQAEWVLLEKSFMAKATCLNAQLIITSNEAGGWWLGAVSSMPANNFHGMRWDVVRLLKQIKPGALRFPGGCYAEFYSWKDGLLPADKRTPITDTHLDFLLPYTNDTDTQEIGIDEFMALCNEIGCEPVLTARLSDNSVEDIADWVEYCNGNANTLWGNQRIARGYTNPYNVRWWFVGNELYYFGRGTASGVTNAATQTNLFAQSMKKADPGIRLVASTRFGKDGVYPEWNKPVLAAADTMIAAVSAHEYILDNMPLSNARDLSNILHAPVRSTRTMMQQIRTFLNSRNDHTTKIIFDEWNTKWGIQGNIPMALYAANMLNMLCREADTLGIDMACFFMPVNEGAISVNPQHAALDAAGHVFDLYKVHQQSRLLRVDADSAVDICASLSENTQQVNITAVNDANSSRILSVAIKGGGGYLQTAQLRRLRPRSLSINETVFIIKEEKIALKDKRAFKVAIAPGEILRITME